MNEHLMSSLCEVRHAGWLGTLVVLLAVSAGPLGAQAARSPTVEEVERAAARYLREQYPIQRIGFQDLSGYYSTPSPVPLERSPIQLAALLQILGGQLVEPPLCEEKEKAGCVDIVFRIDTPRLQGDSAFVTASATSPAPRFLLSWEFLFRKRNGIWWFEREIFSQHATVVPDRPPLH